MSMIPAISSKNRTTAKQDALLTCTRNLQQGRVEEDLFDDGLQLRVAFHEFQRQHGYVVGGVDDLSHWRLRKAR